mgnify:CR=1 FL=1
MRKTFERCPGRGGFTAVELIVALGIVALLAAVFLPALGRTAPRRSVQAARDAFAGLHASARASAIQYGRTTRLRIQPPSRAWVEVDATGGRVDTLGHVLRFDERFDGVSVSATATTLCFGPRGLPVAMGTCPTTEAVVIFRKANAADTVTINAAGQLRR